MTTPDERTRAVILTESFLLSLTNPKETPRIPKEIRQEARMLLRHYPSSFDIEMIVEGWYDDKIHVVFECPFGEGD